jgi:hypothetical protein
MTSLSSSHITQRNFSFKPSCCKLETTLAACTVVAKSSFLNCPFTRLWTLLFWRSLQHKSQHLITIFSQTAFSHPTLIRGCSARGLSLLRDLGLGHNSTPWQVGRPRRKLGSYERDLFTRARWHFEFFTTDGESAVKYA